MKNTATLQYQIPSIFKNTSEELINTLFRAGKTITFKKNQAIYLQGENDHHAYIVLQGLIKVSTSNQANQTMIKDIIYPGSFFGDWTIFKSSKSQESAHCIQNNTIILAIPTNKFKNLASKQPELITILLKEIGKKLIKKEESLASFHFNDARSRILHFLKETAKKKGIKVGYETLIKHSFTQQDIANITGTSRQTVTFVMNSLKKKNIIHFDRKRILIRDLNLLD